MPETPIVEHARAKVNLTLKVVGKLPNGYHALESLVAFAESPADVVTLVPGVATGVTVIGPGASAIVGENLIARALRLAAEAEPGLTLGHVTLEKHLPVAAGVGGGSADAAAVLRAIRRANPELARSVPWLDIAGRLGADVPVCVASTPTFMWGIGERMQPVGLQMLDAVLVNPMLPVPADKTAQVFRRLGAAGIPAEPPRPAIPRAFASAEEIARLMQSIGNDLSVPAVEVVPAISDVLAALDAEPGCRIAQLSGGGPTCFGVYGSGQSATAAAAAIKALHPSWWVAATRLG